MPTFSVDGQSYEVAEDRTILQALDELGLLMNGVDIPHYCWHPKLSIDGSCRLCQVEIEGMPGLQIACNTPVREGMEVRTTTDAVRTAREGVMELLLVNHPLDCPICDQAGECKLQDYAFEYGVLHARTKEPRRALRKNVDLGPTIVFDQERCILCRRCVRFCREVPGTGELAIFSRGDRSTIETLADQPLDNDYSMNVADLCPVGALTTKDFRFKIRVWFLEDVPGVCTGCSNGCNIHLGVANNRVYRYQPRRNDQVNETWICDSGRLSYAEIGAPDRQTEVRVRSAEGPLRRAERSAAVDAAAGQLRAAIDAHGAGAVGVIASPHAANEDLFVLRRLVDTLGITKVGAAVRTGAADALLLKAEKAANAEGARVLGFGDPRAVLDALRAGELRALVVLGHEILGAGFLGGIEPLAGLDALVLLDTHHSELDRAATVVFATRHLAERDGSVTNHRGRVQRVEAAVEPPFEACPEGEVLLEIGAALGLPGFAPGFDPVAISKQLASTLAEWEGLSLDALPPEGALLASAQRPYGVAG